MGLVLGVDRVALAEVCRKYGVAELAVFGSVARGDSTSASDVDLTYVLAPGRRLGWEIEDLSDELSALFCRPVDLVSRRSLHPRIADQVKAESWVLYAACVVDPRRDRRGGGAGRGDRV